MDCNDTYSASVGGLKSAYGVAYFNRDSGPLANLGLNAVAEPQLAFLAFALRCSGASLMLSPYVND